MAATPNVPTGWRRHLWFLTSRKAQISIVTLITLIVGQYGYDLTSKENVIAAGVAIVIAWLLGIAVEDHGSKMGLPTPNSGEPKPPTTLPPNG